MAALVIKQPCYLPFEVASRWQQGTPGGYLKGSFLLPPFWSPQEPALHLEISCVDISEETPHPCGLLVPFFSGRRRERHEDGYRDMEGGVQKKRTLKVIGTQVMAFSERQEIAVAQVVHIEGKWVVKLGSQTGSLRLAIIQPLTKSRKGSDKQEVQRMIRGARISVHVTFGGQTIDKVTSGVISNSRWSAAQLTDRSTRRDTKGTTRRATLDSMESSDGSAANSSSFNSSQVICPFLSSSSVEIPGCPVSSRMSSLPNSWELVTKAAFDLAPQAQTDQPLPSAAQCGSMSNYTESASKNSPSNQLTTWDFDFLRELDDADFQFLGESEKEKKEPILLAWRLLDFSLLDVLAEQKILDANMEKVLSRIRLTGAGQLFDACHWSYRQFKDRPASCSPARLVLHKLGGPMSREGFQRVMVRVRRGENIAQLPRDATEEQVTTKLVASEFSRTIFHFLERGKSFNYVLFIGVHGPVLWRMCHPAVNQPSWEVAGSQEAVSALVQVDENLCLEENAFRFLVEQVQKDLIQLPRELISFHEWYRGLQESGPDLPDLQALTSANMDRLKEIYGNMWAGDI